MESLYIVTKADYGWKILGKKATYQKEITMDDTIEISGTDYNIKTWLGADAVPRYEITVQSDPECRRADCQLVLGVLQELDRYLRGEQSCELTEQKWTALIARNFDELYAKDMAEYRDEEDI